MRQECVLMNDNLPRYTMRIPQELLDKLGYIARYEGRTKNKELEQIVKKRIEEFETAHGKINLDNKPAAE